MTLRNPDPPPPDVLSTWLSELRFNDAYVVLGDMGVGEAVRIAPEGVPTFHYAQRGGCLVEFGDHTRLLSEGDVLLMRRGLARAVGRRAGDPPTPIEGLVRRAVVSGRIATFESGAAEERARILGVAACPIDCRVPALEALPAIAHVRADTVPGQLRDLLAHLIDEAAAGRAAAEPIVARLTELVVLLAARTVLQHVDAVPALTAAARDRQLGAALGAIHRSAATPWTVRGLARVAGMSRSAFAARFRAVLGVGPIQYVQRERMRVARRLLDAGEPVQVVADAVGYASATSFSSAFRRVEGLPPSAVRRR